MIDWRFVVEAFNVIKGGLPLTVGIFAAGYLLAIALGLAFAVLEQGGRAVSISARTWTSFWRRTPLLVQLYFIFFALPQVGISLTPIYAGITGLSLHYSAFASEAFRASILSIPRGQWHAASALSLSRAHTWRRIIAPQVIPRALPALGNYGLGLMKETALLSTIGVFEMFARARALSAQTFRFVEPMSTVAVIYLVLSVPFVIILHRLEKSRPVR